jgi:regulator of ribonuclease activity A
MIVKTADLCDQHAAYVQVAAPIFRDYGSVLSFHGQIVTVKVHEDNKLVREAFEQRGDGKVLIIDGGGSLRCGLVGDRVADMARNHGWAGVVVYGCVRDARELAQTALGIKALNTNPFRSAKWGAGERNIPVTFAGVTFAPGHYVYADEDGIIVSPNALI